MIKISRAEILDYFYITVGVTLYAISVAFFLLPYKLTTGGVAGIGALIYYATGFEVQNTYLLVNLLLLILAVKELGWRFCFRTIYAVGSLTFMLWLTQRLYEMFGSPMLVGDELFMSCLIGAILEGIALGFCFVAGGSTGGTDIIAAIVNKYRNMSLGTVIMLLDIIIISSCYFVFHDVQRVVFGYVLLIVSSVTLDYYVNRIRQAVEFKIYSRNPNAIANEIMKTGHGVTILDGMGFYTKSERKVIVSVVRKSEQMMLFRMIKSIDPYCFVTMGNVSGVWGEGFDVMKVKENAKTKKRHVVVFATDNEADVEEARILFGDQYEIRSLVDIGCDLTNPVNTDIQSGNAILKARFVKKFYGFDSIASGTTLNDSQNAIFAVATGDPLSNFDVDKFSTIEDVKAFFDKKK